MRLVLILVLGLWSASAADFAAGFDHANKLYEQGKFEDAAAGYQTLIQQGAVSPNLYFNLGNAWFKAGQTGRAIAAYRQAEQLAPRDPNVRFNLQFARRKVTGSDAGPGSGLLRSLTLEEWTLLAAAAYWIFFALLILRELRPAWRASLRNVSVLAGFAFVVAASLCFAAYRSPTTRAVVVSPNAIVRYGPLDESQVFYQLRDGAELTVLDQKRTAENQVWLQVQDASRRTGWLKQQEVIVIRAT